MGFVNLIKQWTVIHLLFMYSFLIAGVVLNFVQLCTVPLIWPFSKTLYRRVNNFLGWAITCPLPALAEWWSNSDVTVIMSDEDYSTTANEHGVVIMNHKYDIEWLMGWIVAERMGVLGGAKVFAKRVLQYVPIIGWNWYFQENCFLDRDWARDKITIKKKMEKYSKYPDDLTTWLLLFCEGTRFTKQKLKASNEVARQKGLPELKHHLLPRTKGFTLIMTALKGNIPCIYDCTIAFDTVNGAEPTLLNLLNGKRVVAEMHIRRIDVNTVPTETEEASAMWLHKIYKEKDDRYDEFLKNNCFSGKRQNLKRRPYDLLLCLFWILVTWIPLFYCGGALLYYGSLLVRVGFLVIGFILTVVMKLFISVTEVQKGSSYGKVEKTVNNNKKDE